MMTRRSFMLELAAVALFGCSYAHQKRKTFEEELKAEVEDMMKKHAYEENNDSTHRFIEAEIDDWAHEYVMSGELDAFKVQCGSDETGSCEKCWVQCMFKKHGAKKAKVLTCEVSL